MWELGRRNACLIAFGKEIWYEGLGELTGTSNCLESNLAYVSLNWLNIPVPLFLNCDFEMIKTMSTL